MQHSWRKADVIVGPRADDSYFQFARSFLSNTIIVATPAQAMKLGGLGQQFVLKSEVAFERIVPDGWVSAPGDIYYPRRKARRFETGVPGDVAGKSGTELAMAVIRDTGGLPAGGDYPSPSDTVKPSEEFWAGWALAYSQWRDNLRFRDLLSVVPVNKVIAMYYPYHEASEDKFADFVADQPKARPFTSAPA